jgi:hypothetical protein
MLKTAAFAASILALAIAAPGAAHAQVVKFSGCTFPGVEPGCFMLRDGPKIYNIGSAKPRPLPYRGITGVGILKPGPSFCFADTLIKIRWRYTKQLCPKW